MVAERPRARVWLAVGGLVLALLLGFVLRRRVVHHRIADSPSSQEAMTDVDAPAPGPSHPSRLAREDERAALLGAIAAARARRTATTTPASRALPDPGNRRAPAAEAANPVGELDKEYVRKQVRELLPLLRECYDNARERHPDLAGKMVVRFVMGGEPEVGGVIEESEVLPASTITEPDMVECVRETMYALRFEPPAGGGRVTVHYPLVFHSEPPADGGN
jgi:hypothetical protein